MGTLVSFTLYISPLPLLLSTSRSTLPRPILPLLAHCIVLLYLALSAGFRVSSSTTSSTRLEPELVSPFNSSLLCFICNSTRKGSWSDILWYYSSIGTMMKSSILTKPIKASVQLVLVF